MSSDERESTNMSATLIWWIVVPALIVVSMLALIWFGQKKRQHTDLPITYIEALDASNAGLSGNQFFPRLFDAAP